MDVMTNKEENAHELVQGLLKQMNNAQLDNQIKAIVKEAIEKLTNISVDHKLSDLIPTTIAQISEENKKLLDNCWNMAKQHIKVGHNKLTSPNKDQQKIQQKAQPEQESDSFKFDSHSQSYSSSYDDVDDDFRKEEMKQEQQNK